ncbi:hypothetical protein EDD16DRAFT_1536162 [Pisolithus croceorrhizus]|nr:hypothetical protein EDD16DRAFT_1536162 [Pisolithus croceorrhizus]
MWKELSPPHLPLVLFSTVCIPIKACCISDILRKNHSYGTISMSSSCTSCVYRIVRYWLYALLLQLAPNNFVRKYRYRDSQGVEWDG